MNPDVIARTLPPGRDGGLDVLAAGRQAVRERERLLTAREAVAIETTLSGRGELAFAARAVAEGGHDVPRADLLRRFDRSLANLEGAMRLADRAYVLENSGLRRRLVLARVDGRTRVLSRRLPDWVERAIPAELRTPDPA